MCGGGARRAGGSGVLLRWRCTHGVMVGRAGAAAMEPSEVHLRRCGGMAARREPRPTRASRGPANWRPRVAQRLGGSLALPRRPEGRRTGGRGWHGGSAGASPSQDGPGAGEQEAVGGMAARWEPRPPKVARGPANWRQWVAWRLGGSFARQPRADRVVPGMKEGVTSCRLAVAFL